MKMTKEELDEIEIVISEKYSTAYKENYQKPTQLVHSENPYRALVHCCAKKIGFLVNTPEIETYLSMKIVHLKRHDVDIIEVG